MHAKQLFTGPKLIKLFPKKHLFAICCLTLALVVTLVLVPNAEVNAHKTNVEIELPSEPTSAAAASLSSINNQISETGLQAATAGQPTYFSENWQKFKVKSGDTLSKLFSNAGFNDKVMYEVLGRGNKNKELTRIFPGEEIHFLSENDSLEKIRLIRSKLETVLFSRTTENGFVSEKITRTPDINIAYAEGQIESSLFLAGQKAGMTQKQIMGLANIFGWDIDFVLDIRNGDTFAITYEELYLDGTKLENGRILTATFNNDGRQFDAVLFDKEDGTSSYFTPDGKSMRKAFIRTPVDIGRISSHFNLKRRHPVLHKVRAHRGTDYAAPTGTPIKASGDGKVIFAGTKGGYGKTVIIQHGQGITTLYAHMHKYAKGARKGKRVSQGQVIGYVGTTGMSTGPHLHYEFRVNGVHKNPVKVKFPHAQPVADSERNLFETQSRARLAQLYTFQNSYSQLAYGE